MLTEPVVNSGDGTTIFSLIIKTYPGDQQRSFTDARGLVINDYQNLLEKGWVEELKKKAECAGFRNVEYRLLTAGIAILLLGSAGSD